MMRMQIHLITTRKVMKANCRSYLHLFGLIVTLLLYLAFCYELFRLTHVQRDLKEITFILIKDFSQISVSLQIVQG